MKWFRKKKISEETKIIGCFLLSVLVGMALCFTLIFICVGLGI